MAKTIAEMDDIDEIDNTAPGKVTSFRPHFATDSPRSGE